MAESHTDIAALLRDYVPKGDHDQVLEALDALDRENADLKTQLQGIQTKLGKDGDVDKLLGRIGELEGKVRSRNYQDAWKAVADELRIDDDFREDLFDSLKFAMDKDDPDARSMKKQAKEWIEAKESRKKYLKPPESKEDDGDGKDGKPAAEKPRLHTEDDAGRGSPVGGGKMFRYRSENLSDPEWMRHNATEYARAAAEGRLQKIV